MITRRVPLSTALGLIMLLACKAPAPSTGADSAPSSVSSPPIGATQAGGTAATPQDSSTDTSFTEDEAQAEAVRAESLTAERAEALVDSIPRKLPPSAYSQLPPRVRQVLDSASCVIAQASGRGDRPNNVLIADLLGNHHRAAAVLCLVQKRSVVYVFDLDSLAPPELVSDQPASLFVEAHAGEDDAVTYEWTRAISVIEPKETADWCIYPDEEETHEGIIDMKLQELVGAYYLRSPGNRWMECHVPDGD